MESMESIVIYPGVKVTVSAVPAVGGGAAQHVLSWTSVSEQKLFTETFLRTRHG